MRPLYITGDLQDFTRLNIKRDASNHLVLPIVFNGQIFDTQHHIAGHHFDHGKGCYHNDVHQEKRVSRQF
jgi:hypothetical protein